jgi:hypothetical protein
MAGQPRNARPEFERRSVVLTLQELADKTPLGEPLLVTMREFRDYVNFQQSRAIQGEPGEMGLFNGRALKVIDEAMLGLGAAVEAGQRAMAPTRTLGDVNRSSDAFFAGDRLDAQKNAEGPYRSGYNGQDEAAAALQADRNAYMNRIAQQIQQNSAKIWGGLEEKAAPDPQANQLSPEMIAKLTQIGMASQGAGVARAGSPVTLKPVRTSERNIPVGQSRGYFEE